MELNPEEIKIVKEWADYFFFYSFMTDEEEELYERVKEEAKK